MNGVTTGLDAPLYAGWQSPPPPPRGLDAYPRRELVKGERLYGAGDPADTVFRVDQGLVKLSIDVPYGRERIVGVAGPGDLIGALTPAQIALRESAEALSASVVVTVVPRMQASDFERALFRAAGDQLARVTVALEDGELPVGARLARALLRLGERFGQLSEGGVVRLTLPLTHENLAALIGAARETTTAALGDLRRLGLLEGTRGRYRFRREPLVTYAHGNHGS
jgi:CRP/FNR family transcriptional regulator, cyclic AMP receptor protein